MDLLEQVTQVTLDALKNKMVVMPTDYFSTFKEHAGKYGLDLSDEEVWGSLAEASIVNAREITEKTEKNIHTLAESAREASRAIVDQDAKKLQEIDARMQAMEAEIGKLRNQIYRDGLTRVKNRKWMEDHLLNGALSIKQGGVLIFIDLNDFKIVNDTYGHIVGDKVLVYTANFLAKMLKSDLGRIPFEVIRYGGDEFIIYVASKASEQIERYFIAYQERLAKTELKAEVDGKKGTFRYSFSYGVVGIQEGDSFLDAVDASDRLMYANKKAVKQKFRSHF